MEDYKEPISKVQKRRQLKRLFAIMGGMVFVFVVFILGVIVGIHLQKEKVRISQSISTQAETNTDKEKETTAATKETPAVAREKEQKMRFTFYETLTKKETQEKKTRKEERKKAEVGLTPTHKSKQVKKALAQKGLYFVQVGSFKKKDRADSFRDKLIKKGYKACVTPVKIENKGLWYRVRLGGYKTLKEAQRIKKRISAQEGIKGARVVSEP
ncbi:MAG: hypothetical protein DRG50_04595 [Deltaproteobacteria bacterium]|nr:MAG: hypothetical protein DRG50_04595 [Deltaproteobacteria bacterium]